MSLGERVKDLRKAAGLTQAQLAAAVTAKGIRLAQQAVVSIEQSDCRPRALPEIAEVLGTTPEFLIGRGSCATFDARSAETSRTEPLKAAQRIVAGLAVPGDAELVARVLLGVSRELS